jgi:hypothetical protein
VEGLVVHTCNPAFGRLRQEDQKFQASLGYMISPCQKKPPKKQKEKKEINCLKGYFTEVLKSKA